MYVCMKYVYAYAFAKSIRFGNFTGYDVPFIFN